MPTITKTWHFSSDMEGWTVTTGGATGITYGWRGTDGASGSANGCIYVRRDGQNLSDGYIQVRRQLQFSDLGIPANATITRISGSYYARCSDWSNGSTASLSTDLYFSSSRFGTKSSGAYRSYSGTTSWALHNPTDFTIGALATDQVTIIFELQPRTANVAGAYVELRADYVTVSVDYVVPPEEPTGALSVVVKGSPDTDVSSYVSAGSIQIQRESNGGVSTAKFSAVAGTLADPLQATLQTGARVQILAGSEVLFDGEVSSIDISTQSKNTRYAVSLRDAIAKLDRVSVAGLSWSSTTVGAIVADLIQNYAGGAVSSDISQISDSRSVSSFAVQADSVAAALRSLAAAYPSIWYLDPSLVLHWRASTIPEASGRQYLLSDSSQQKGVHVDSLQIGNDMGRLANHVTVISSYDTVTTTNWSANPPVGSDDGYLSGAGTSFPVAAASSADTAGAELLVRAANTAPSVQTTLSFASRARSGKTGPSWPPATPFAPNDDYVQSVYWPPPSEPYEIQCQGFRFDTPASSNPILQTEIILTVANVADNTADNQNTIWVELAFAENYGQATSEPSGTWFGVTLTAGTHTITVPNVSWNSTFYYRVGIRSGQPAGLNQAEITNCQLRITYQDLAASQYEESRALIRFDSSAIPDAANITAASLKLYVNSLSTPSWAQLELYSINPSIWPIDTSDWAPTATLLAQIALSSGWNTISLPLSAVNKTGYTALLLRYSSGSVPPSLQEAKAAIASQDAASNKPSLNVTYTTVTPGVSATAQDSSSQSTYGVRKFVLARPGSSQADCARIAAEELGKRAWPAKTARLQARAGHLMMPGQSAFLNCSPYLSAGFYAATAVAVKYTPQGPVYDIELIGGANSLETYLLEVLK